MGKILEIIKKYNIDVEKLKSEQKKFAKLVVLKDSFEIVEKIAGCKSINFRNKVIAAFVVLNENFELLEQKYAIEKATLPYISEFRAYSELPAIIAAYKKLDEIPDVIFVEGHGIAHPRMCGLASHFGIAVSRPTIGISKKLLFGEIKEGKIYIEKKEVGIELKTKFGAKPIYVSPGHLISLDTSLKLTKKFIKENHKLPEPLALANKLAKRVMAELREKG